MFWYWVTWNETSSTLRWTCDVGNLIILIKIFSEVLCLKYFWLCRHRPACFCSLLGDGLRERCELSWRCDSCRWVCPSGALKTWRIIVQQFKGFLYAFFDIIQGWHDCMISANNSMMDHENIELNVLCVLKTWVGQWSLPAPNCIKNIEKKGQYKSVKSKVATDSGSGMLLATKSLP